MAASKMTTLALLIALGVTAVAAGKPATDASIQKLIAVTRVKEQMTGMVGQVETMMRAQMQQGYEKAAGKLDDPEVKALLDRFTDDVVAIVTSEMTSPEMIEDLIKAYSSVYTEEEVQAQIKFYSSEVGQKVVQRGPELMKAMMALMQQRMPTMQAKLATVMNEFQARAFELRAKKLREKSQGEGDEAPKPGDEKKP